MPFTIAFSGKGGTGKTTLSALCVKYFLKKGIKPVLAVDADPNSNLNVALGIEFSDTIADAREEILDKKVPAGISKTDFISGRIEELISEGEGIDLLVMGRPEGPGCYCAVNNLLRDYLGKISKRYKAVVVDTEAGMEHLSRRTTDDLDILFIVANPDPISITAASRIQKIAKKLKLKIKNTYFILNRADNKISDSIQAAIKKSELSIFAIVPEEKSLKAASEEGRAILEIPATAAEDKIKSIMDKLVQV